MPGLSAIIIACKKFFSVESINLLGSRLASFISWRFTRHTIIVPNIITDIIKTVVNLVGGSFYAIHSFIWLLFAYGLLFFNGGQELCVICPTSCFPLFHHTRSCFFGLFKNIIKMFHHAF